MQAAKSVRQGFNNNVTGCRRQEIRDIRLLVSSLIHRPFEGSYVNALTLNCR